ncbi:MAG: hypothetical protein MI919_31400, partial [Holophagales bacterium]|nr:hypothetical protein [Holophagales bacterium]
PVRRRGGRRVALFAPRHREDAPTQITADHLASPLEGWLGRRAEVARVAARLGEWASRRALLELFGSGADLLVTAGHSVTFPPGHPCQEPRMGAVVCSDWPGPGSGAIGPDQSVAAVDVPEGALRGGVALLFGCHTAGVPQADPFDDLSPAEARPLTERAFSSALGQRLLGLHGGALGVIGHVGRAFEASVWWRGVRQTATFEDAIASVLDGERLGQSMEAFRQRHADLLSCWASATLGPAFSPGAPPAGDGDTSSPDLLDLWVGFHDSRSWSLLGDPAVRLAPAVEAP